MSNEDTFEDMGMDKEIDQCMKNYSDGVYEANKKLFRFQCASEKSNDDRFFQRTLHADFNNLIEELDNLKRQGYRFRGLCDARYMLFSSAQIEFANLCRMGTFDKKLQYRDYLCELLAFMKDRNVLPSRKKSILCDHEIWGWLQHYGCPTPMQDFSDSYEVALFMALRNPYRVSRDGFSIYAIQAGASKMKNGNDLVDLDWMSLGGTGYMHCSDSSENYARKLAYSGWQGKFNRARPTVWFISQDYRNWNPTLSQGRMSIQTGLFVYHDSETEPLDEVLRIANHPADSNGNSEGCQFEKIKCIDIDRTLIASVQEFVEKRGVSWQSMLLSSQDQLRMQSAVENAYKRFLQFLKRNCNS